MQADCRIGIFTLLGTFTVLIFVRSLYGPQIPPCMITRKWENFNFGADFMYNTMFVDWLLQHSLVSVTSGCLIV